MTEESPRLKSKKELRKTLVIALIVSLIAGSVSYYFNKSLLTSLIVGIVFGILSKVYRIASKVLKEAADKEKMELVFPDFIQLMSSNLRAGITIDKALLLSSRKEFAPLDKEILHLGKDIITGKEVSLALKEMARRINSEKITKTIELIITGIGSGGNLSIILDETAINMRERLFVEKRAASNVLMYVIFIFFAVAFGSPGLFALSSVMVDVLKGILLNVPVSDTPSSFGLTLTSINISTTFIFYFSLIFLIVTDILASLVLGLVSKGEEKAGIRYMVPLVIISILVFVGVRFILNSYFGAL